MKSPRHPLSKVSGRSWFSHGVLFGFPRCCIRSFIKRGGLLFRPKKEYDKYQTTAFAGTGFIPCKRCSNLKPHVVMKRIGQKRHPRLRQFPHG